MMIIIDDAFVSGSKLCILTSLYKIWVQGCMYRGVYLFGCVNNTDLLPAGLQRGQW